MFVAVGCFLLVIGFIFGLVLAPRQVVTIPSEPRELSADSEEDEDGRSNQEASSDQEGTFSDIDDPSDDDEEDQSIRRHFYLAGSYQGRQDLKPLIGDLMARGYECTWNWPEAEVHGQDHTTMGHFAAKDIQGVLDADVVVAVVDDPSYAYRGTFTEIGCALGSGKPVIVFCPIPHGDMYARTNCFFCHPAITHTSTWEETLEEVAKHLD